MSDETPTKKPKAKRRKKVSSKAKLKADADKARSPAPARASTPRAKLLSRKDLVDPTDLLNQAIQSGLESGYSDIDDGDMPKAPNSVEWVIGAKYLNVKPFPKQLQDIMHFFTAACYFCSDAEYLADVPRDAAIGDILDRSTLMRYGKCPKCKRTVTEMRYEWCLDPTHAGVSEGLIKTDVPNEACCLKGQRSGKSIQTAMMASYISHRYLKLPNPSRWFRLLKRQVLHSTFVSVTATQAWENLWQPFSDLVDGSPWFSNYHDFLDAEGERLGRLLWAKKDTYLWYGHKRLAHSFAPADVRTLRGRTRLLSAIDEWSWFATSNAKTAKIRADGDGTWRAMDRSLATVRAAAVAKRRTHPDTPDGYMITISSPSSVTDPMVRRQYRAKDSPRVYAVKQATWDAHPTFTEEILRAQEGNVNESEFMCDFGCEPPYSDNPWWDSREHLLGLCRKDPNEPRPWKTTVDSVPDPLAGGNEHDWIWSVVDVVGADRQTPRVLALDTGATNNSFSWCLAHYDKYIDSVIIDEVGELAPGAGQRIHFGNMWEFAILPMVSMFRLIHVVWDNWESSTYVSDLRTKHKVRAEQYSVTRADSKGLKSDMLNSKISLPMPERPFEELPVADPVVCSQFPRTHLLLQVMTVRDQGGVPLKPQGGTDDTFRAMLLARTYIRENEKEYGFYRRGHGGFVGVGGGRGRRSGIVTGAGGSGTAVGGRRR